MVAPTLFNSPLGQTVLVFVLVFVSIFAILQKSKVFGDGKKQIDALVAVAMALIVASVGYAIDLISNLVPVMAVALVVIIVFMILFGAVHKDALDLPKGVRYTFGIAIFIAVAIAVMYFTPAWDYIQGMLYGGEGSAIFMNIIFILVVVGAIAAVLAGGKSNDSSKPK